MIEHPEFIYSITREQEPINEKGYEWIWSDADIFKHSIDFDVGELFEQMQKARAEQQ